MKWNNNIKARDSLLLCGSNKVPPDTEPVALPIAPRSFLAKTLGWLDLLRKKDSKPVLHARLLPVKEMICNALYPLILENQTRIWKKRPAKNATKTASTRDFK